MGPAALRMSPFLRPLQPESNELLHLDCLRLIASTAIVFLHLSVKLRGILAPNNAVTSPLSLFVDLFFVVSGFVIAFVYWNKLSSLGEYARFLRKRVARLGPLHWATLIIFALLGIFGNVLGAHVNHPEMFDMRCFLPNVLFMQATPLCKHLSFNGPAWSISAEFCMYLAAPLFFLLARRGILLIAGVAALWFAGVTIFAHGSAWLDWTAPAGPLRAVPSFCLGICLFLLRKQLTYKFGEIWMWGSLALFLTSVVFRANWFILLALLYAAVIFAICADSAGRASSFVRIAAAGGQLTYSSYLTHDLVFMVMLTIVGEHALHLDGMGMNALVLLAFVIVWPVSYGSFLYFERPMRQWISGHRDERDGQTNTTELESLVERTRA